MNLKVYQEYADHVKAFQIGLEKYGYEETIVNRRDSMKKLKAENPEEYLKQKTRFLRNIVDAENIVTNKDTAIYEIDDKIKLICAFSNVPQNVEKYAFLPSKYIFIDVDFTDKEVDIKENRIFGIALREASLLHIRQRKEYDLADATERKRIDQEDYVGKCINALVFSESANGHIFLDSLTFAYNLTEEYEDLKVKTDRKIPTRMFVKKFVLNFLSFLNDKEVLEIRHKRGKKNQERRIRNHKVVLPDSRILKITGILKKYVDEKSEKSGWHYSFRFPVREHRRKLYDEFGNIRKVIKIEKYYKGKGVLVEIDTHYKVVADKKHRRVKKWNQENIDMKDIKPLKKPLREMRCK